MGREGTGRVLEMSLVVNYTMLSEQFINVGNLYRQHPVVLSIIDNDMSFD